uniref:Uncharacterized protein n=1 Tax=Chromera velia CCMP2878 TaxID=1169474 RepID=A0A0G4GJS2_9ALVE|eukprot:Cvel_22200.t1-p1 / transcript=Cvel_22200.t1 / gene=Cvel_22200 / organism=Chromera_velia_CCMP2878 / gene_product=hypothetical protein / transcript_product=hypothetical protein / location=Cvel_scaffold2156:21659-23348(-) / protein_length=332 / sequence_SO=supercontig / SO=protein_coding / is_pseudo=false
MVPAGSQSQSQQIAVKTKHERETGTDKAHAKGASANSSSSSAQPGGTRDDSDTSPEKDKEKNNGGGGQIPAKRTVTSPPVPVPRLRLECLKRDADGELMIVKENPVAPAKADMDARTQLLKAYHQQHAAFRAAHGSYPLGQAVPSHPHAFQFAPFSRQWGYGAPVPHPDVAAAAGGRVEQANELSGVQMQQRQQSHAAAGQAVSFWGASANNALNMSQSQQPQAAGAVQKPSEGGATQAKHMPPQPPVISTVYSPPVLMAGGGAAGGQAHPQAGASRTLAPSHSTPFLHAAPHQQQKGLEGSRTPPHALGVLPQQQQQSQAGIHNAHMLRRV